MDLKRCDRCKKELQIGKVNMHRLLMESYDKEGNVISAHEEDLCSKCHHKVKKLLGVK